MMNKSRFFALAAALILSTGFIGKAQQTERFYLSGTGSDDTTTWEFKCSAGNRSGVWSTIQVPSQWEQQGFGEYDYGRHLGTAPTLLNEEGYYRYRFQLPRNWKGKTIKIVFEGVMTDAQVKINGQSAGPVHQGGFYRFEYDVTKLLRSGSNLLEVKVSKESANASVNNAERHADWWNFGGIYRPVYLSASPKQNISHFAVDAKADGAMNVVVELAGAPQGSSLRYTLVDGDKTVGSSVLASGKGESFTHSLKWEGVKTWDCEHPNLYTLKIDLLSDKGKILHSVSERIGFRTVELRVRDGLYVNGVKLVLKGVNRHVFHPQSGRCSNKSASLADALLIKDMNMNAVRSHYPPDEHFLDVCDSLGLFYLDELAGWHGRYDDAVGPQLVREMVRKDVNHPSIILWDNGNEGGWNTKLDKLFYEYDPQQRHVIHPWADFDDLDTHHYPTYLTGVGRFTNGYKVFMPTEFMHTNSDQGGGAGLEDFWDNWTRHPLFAGGFIWAFVDESIERRDMDDKLDCHFDMGNDGLVGPYREKEGSYYAVKHIWSPVQIRDLFITPSFKGDFYITNKYLFSDLSEVKMVYRLKRIQNPAEGAGSSVSAKGEIKVPVLAPNTTGIMHFDLPEGFFDNDLLELEAFAADGSSICTWTWPIRYANDYFKRHNPFRPASGKAGIKEEGGSVKLCAAGLSAGFNPENGNLESLELNGKKLPFGNMRPVGMKMRFVSASHRLDGDDAVFVAKYLGAVDSIVWRMKPDGKLGMDAVLLNRDNGGIRGGFDDGFTDTNVKDLGFAFDFPESAVKSMDWMGRGPYRVWKNRQRGHNIDFWSKDYNNTITARAVKGELEYPEFKGYHANIYWARLNSDEYPMTVYSETDGLFFKVFNLDEPEDSPAPIFPQLPEGDLAFLLDIQAIKSFKSIPQQGPKSQPGNIRIKSGDEGLRMTLWFDFLKEQPKPSYRAEKLRMEKLGRGLVAVRHQAGKAFLSWRYLSSDASYLAFDVYRNGRKINSKPISDRTWFIDENAPDKDIVYEVKPIGGQFPAGTFTLAKDAVKPYLDIPIEAPADQIMPDGQTARYSPGDCSLGDADGDGEYELFLKWDPSNAHDNAHNGYTGTVFIDCLKLSGERLWRIDLGRNIRAGAHYTQFMVYDLDGDGCAELVCKTADGTTDAAGTVLGDKDADYRVHDKALVGRIMSGPEYLSVFDGRSGKFVTTVDYLPGRGENGIWGDTKANRCDRFLGAIAYLDGENPSVVMCRGYYTRTTLSAYDFDGKQLRLRWHFDSFSKPEYKAFEGQGNHNLRVADVDGDGCDEIVYGSCCIDHDGSGLYSNGLGHGDAMHIGQMIPGSEALQVWIGHENDGVGSALVNAHDGQIITHIPAKGDIGRCMAADIDPTNPGWEMWSLGTDGILNWRGEKIAEKAPSCNFAIWWDGDLSRELLDRNHIDKFNPQTRGFDRIETFEGASSINGTKATPLISADILGDWREELVLRSDDGKSLRLYLSTIPTAYRFHCFMDDPVYRCSVANENVCYNQPPEASFYFGEDLKEGPFRGTLIKKASTPKAIELDNSYSDNTPDSLDIAKTARPVAGSSRKGDNPVLFLVGDSTMRTGTRGNGDNGQWGWGYYAGQFFDPERISVENHALGGLSIRTFYNGWWPDVLKGIRKGDYVIIQLGHNDSGPYDTPKGRSSIPGTGNESVQVTKEDGSVETVLSYGEYLRRFISDIRSRGAMPIVFTLTPRNQWDDGHIRRKNTSYNVWMREVCSQTGAPLIEFEEESASELESFSRMKVDYMFYNDNIHSSEYGARRNAQVAAKVLAKSSETDLGSYLLPFSETFPVQEFTRQEGKPVLFVTGDSTIQNNDSDPDGMWGWGSVLDTVFDSERITLVNAGKAGRSARTFLDEGRWEKVYNALRPGDFVVIQFGHNDFGEISTGRARADLPNTSDDTEIHFMPDHKYQVIRSYGWYLRKFIDEVREKGATPILVSCTPRNEWPEGKIERREFFIRLAEEVRSQTGVDFVDMLKISADYYDSIGREATAAYFKNDHTHSSKLGALRNARSFGEGLRQSRHPLSEYLK